MSLVDKIEQIVLATYPDATYLLASEFQTDYQSYFESDNVLIVLNNTLDEESTIQENANQMDRHRIQLSVYIKDEFDTTNAESNTLVEEAKIISKTLYQKIWLLPDVNAQLSDGRVTHRPFIKPLNSIRSGVLSLSNWSVNEVIDCVSFSEVDLILSSGVGGSTVPVEDTYTFNIGETTAIYAQADIGHRFLNWLIDNSPFTDNPISVVMDKTKTAIASFIAQYQLTTSVSGNGSITPSSAIYDDGDSVEIEAIADVDNEFTKFEVDGIEELNNPFDLVMDNNKTVVAFFSLILTDILNVFTTASIYISDGWYFEDLTEFDNNVKINESQVVHSDGINDYATIIGVRQNGESMVLELHFILDSGTVLKTIFSSGGQYSSLKGITIKTYYNQLRVYTSDGTTGTNSVMNCSSSIVNGEIAKVIITWDCITGSTLTANVNGDDYTTTNVIGWIGLADFDINIFANVQTFSDKIETKLSYLKLNDLFEYLCDNSKGDKLIDSLGNGNDATFINGEAQIWDSKLNVEPFHYTRGFSVDAGIIIPENQSNLGYDTNGNLLDYPKGIGIISILGNKYNIPVDVDLNLIIPSGDYTWQELYDLPEDSQLIKTKTLELISRLIVKKKLSSVMTEYNNLTDFNNLSEYNA